MGISAGTKLGPYTVTDAIGAGGMGEVYRALDTRLDRTVAIKVLPHHLSSDAQRRERFQREAKAISGLSHPNICSLYDIGEQDGTHYLVLEYLEGESLADRLRKGPLSITETLKVGAEVASALETAHKNGIVHRDLKPANVMLTKTGAKLLDFGLAKPAVVAAAASADAATLAKSLTEEGTIVGTFQYMAPEQLEGTEADARSDIFALGTMLYEMATGTPAFSGKTRVSLIASILSSEPKPMTEVSPLSPPAFEHVVRTCLAKDPEERFQSAHDLLVQLRWISTAGSQVGAAPVLARRHKLRFRAAWMIAAASTMALLAITVIGLLRTAPPTPPAVRAYLQPVKGASFSTAQIALSPDGSRLVYRQAGVTNPRLFIQSLASGVAQPLSDSATALWPFFSPDSKYVGYCDNGKLQKFDVAGGQVIPIADAPGCLSGSWNSQGVILFVGNGGIMQVLAGGGSPEVVLAADEKTKFFFPSFLPDGRHFLVAVRTAGKTADAAADNAICIGDLKKHSYSVLLQTSAGSTNPAIPVAQYANGYVVYGNNNNLMARRFDPDKLRFTTDSVALGPRAGLAAVSSAGVLAYFAPGEAPKSEIRWVGRGGQQLGRIGEPQLYDNVRLSPDSSRIAYQLYNGTDGSGAIWVYDISRNVTSRVTFEANVNDDRPVWSPDGKYLLFYRLQDTSIRKVLASGLGGEELVLNKAYPDDWSPDGRYIAYDTGSSSAQIGIYDVAAKKSSVLLNITSANHDARFSPDSKFLAYTSDESGQNEIYVVPFPNLTEKWQVSSGGGTRASWRRDGKELYYLSTDGKLMAVPIGRNGDKLNIGTPIALFQAPFQTAGANISNVGRPYDPAADGQKFIMNSSIETTVEPLTLVTNWTSLVKK